MRVFAVLLVALVFNGCSSDDGPAEEPELVGTVIFERITEVSDGVYERADEVVGSAQILATSTTVTLNISLREMTTSSAKAVHIHQGTVEAPGRHWNAGSFITACNERSLGEVWARPKLGDVGNVEIGSDGSGTFSLTTDLWSIGTGEANDILGLPIIIHEEAEDFLLECDPEHTHDLPHMNPKIAGGTILSTTLEQ